MHTKVSPDLTLGFRLIVGVFCQMKRMYAQDFIHDTDEGYYLFLFI